MAHACGHVLSLQRPLLVGASAHVECRGKAGLKCCSSSAPSLALRASRQPASTMATETAIAKSVVTEGRLGGGGGGAGVLERPGLDQSSPDTAPRTEEGTLCGYFSCFSTGRRTQRS